MSLIIYFFFVQAQCNGESSVHFWVFSEREHNPRLMHGFGLSLEYTRTAQCCYGTLIPLAFHLHFFVCLFAGC